MKKAAKAFLVSAAFLVCAPPCFSKELSVIIVDGLGRPVEGAEISIYWLNAKSEDDVKRVNLLSVVSRADGSVKGDYDEKSVPVGRSVWSEIHKQGYSGFSMDRVESKYELEKEFSTTDIEQIAGMSGEAQKNSLKELLAGTSNPSEKQGIEDFIFVHEKELRPALRSLVGDSVVGIKVIQRLTLIGEPEDLILILDNAPKPNESSPGNRWAYHVVTSLLDPSTEKEWSFLEKCAAGDYQDAWVDEGAIETMKLIAKPESAEILQGVLKKNKRQAYLIQMSLDYLKTNSVSLLDTNLNEAANKVAQAIKIGKWQKNENIRYNQDHDKALVDCVFISGRDLLVHTATFHRVEGVWKLRGVRETLQAFLAKPSDSDK